jgi:tetratricopeptide (TPR) repeat protein
VSLVLRAVDVAGPWRWRWLLSDGESGLPLADHAVDLDPACDEVAVFGDLYEYVGVHASPDRWDEDEARIVARAGAWAGCSLLGERVGAAIVDAAPVTVRVLVPAQLEHVLGWPLELAQVAGVPLAARGEVTLVYDVPAGTVSKGPVGKSLRVLAVFSQPASASVLALRRERYALGRLIRRIVARDNAAVELRVVQYGVTRERLAQIAGEAPGWDVLHLSGHGTVGAFLLERADGSPDLVTAAELVGLLRPGRRRVKLAVLSACESAAGATARTLRLIGLDEQAQAVEAGQAGAGQAAAAGAGGGGLARLLVAELGCAVVGMRYPVLDEFAIGFGEQFYGELLRAGQPVDVALARAVSVAAGGGWGRAGGRGGWPVSLGTPGLFGERALGLTLAVPHGRPQLDPAEVKMERFPPEPERFVGRAEAMAVASAALSPGSGRTAVVLHGMAGAGKTACALELAYRHRDGFGAVAFWQAPTREGEWAGALASLAAALEVQLGGYGFTMAGHIGSAAAVEEFVPRLRRLMADSGVLLVLDNLETLLTPDGGWRDPAWGLLVGALAGHDGESRLVLTSRIAPVGLGTVRATLTVPVHALSLPEGVALARELPNLRRLLHADAGPVRSTPDAAVLAADAAVVAADRDRVRRVLRVVQGHPKLLELADAAAADRDRLDTQLAAAEAAAAGQGLDAFFRDGTSALGPDQFLAALTGWTTTALAVLPEPARLMAQLLACVEDEDRQSGIVDATWAGLWRRLERPGDPPGPGPLLTLLAGAALIQPGTSATPDGDAGPLVVYRLHPGVAAAVFAGAGPGIGAVVDAELAAFWAAVSGRAREREGGEDTGLVVRAGLAAAPYLLRRRDWDTAGSLLERAIIRDGSPGTVQASLPSLRRIAAATGAAGHQAVLARALATVDPARAEQLMRGALATATGNGDYWLASATATKLANLLRDSGRLREALDVLTEKADYTRRAGLGPWTQLGDQAQRLQILSNLGEHDQVLAQTGQLREQMARLPARPGADDPVSPWNVREVILDTGYHSAVATGRWQLCLDLTAEIAASQRERGAGVHERTRTRFNDAWPLIRLGRLDEAGRLLRDCQRVFEEHRDIPRLARVLSTRADLEATLGHRDAAADLARTALRLHYAHPDPRDIAASHHNLANYLGAGDRAGRRAHRLAAALLLQITGDNHELARAVRELAAELRGDLVDAGLPATVAEVIEVAERTEGVRLGALLDALEPERRVVEGALAEILRDAAAMGEESGAEEVPASL